MIYGSGIGILLLGAAAGYLVLERAETHKGQLKQVGRLVGAMLIVVGLIGAVCRIISLATGYCPGDGKGWCPYAGKARISAPATK